MLALILAEIRAVPADRSRGRHNPRVVKRKMSNFPTRSRAAASDRRRWSYEDHIHILPPAGPPPSASHVETPEPAPVAGPPTIKAHQPAETTDRHHVKAWRASGLSRADYCCRHGLKQDAFNRWVDRQRPSVRPKYRKAQGDP